MQQLKMSVQVLHLEAQLTFHYSESCISSENVGTLIIISKLLHVLSLFTKGWVMEVLHCLFEDRDEGWHHGLTHRSA